MRYKPSSPLFVQIILGSLMVGFVFVAYLPPAQALSFPVSPSVAVNTNTTNALWPGAIGGSCTWQNWFYAYWVDSTTSIMYVASSQDGVTWTAPAAILTLTSIGTWTSTADFRTLPYKMTCNGNIILVVWSSVNAGSSATTLTNYMFYSVGSMSGGTVVMGATVTGPKTQNGFVEHNNSGAGANSFSCLAYIAGVAYYCVSALASHAQSLIANNAAVFNFTTNWFTQPYGNLIYNGANYLMWDVGDCKYAVVGSVSSFPTSPTTFSSGVCSGQGGNGYGTAIIGGDFYIPTFVSAGTLNFIADVNNAGTVVASHQWTATFNANQFFLTTDGTTNFVVIGCIASSLQCQYSYTLNTWATFTSAAGFVPLGSSVGATQLWSVSGENTFSAQLGAFAIETGSIGSPYEIYETVLGIPVSQVSTGIQNIGQCPAKNTNTFTMVNNTIYIYYASTFSAENVQTVQADVAAVAGVTSHTLQFVVYSTPAAGPVSPSNLLTLNFAKQIALTGGTKNAQIVVQVPGVTFSATGGIWGVGIIGDDKITLNQSSLAGLFTLSGAPASTSPQNSFYTNQGTSSGTELALCGTAQYLLVQTTTVTKTVTSISTTGGGTATTTVTSVFSSLDTNAAMTSSTSYVLIIIMLLGPAVILGAVGALTRSAALTGGLFIGGMAIGAGAGNLSGIIPFNILALVVVVIVLLIMALIMAMTRGGGGGA